MPLPLTREVLVLQPTDTTNRERYDVAVSTATDLDSRFQLADDRVPKTAIILGTGWGDTITLEDERSITLHELPGFERLQTFLTRQCLLCHGCLNGHLVFVLRRRIHTNEVPNSVELADMVRLQIEMLCVLGVKTFVLTAAVGGLLRGHALKDRRALTGTVCVIDGFVTLFAPDMPLYGGEFVSPEDTLDSNLRQMAMEVGREVDLDVFEGGHVMVRGPFFEGRRYDKSFLARTGASVVGMSILPEACVAALYGARVLALGFVSNDDAEKHSDELVRQRAKNASDKLGALLEGIIPRL